jgi:hypothetical protein
MLDLIQTLIMIMVVPAFIHLLLKCVSINVMASDDSSHFLSPVCFQILYWIDAAL